MPIITPSEMPMNEQQRRELDTLAYSLAELEALLASGGLDSLLEEIERTPPERLQAEFNAFCARRHENHTLQ